MANKDEIIATGRRKTSRASVWLRRGTGKVLVNGKEFGEYFPLDIQKKTILSPLKHLNLLAQYDLFIRVKGGGIEGQVIASRLGIARALVNEEGEEGRRSDLKALGYLTRDPRRRERKKYGRAGARKKFQFSKR